VAKVDAVFRHGQPLHVAQSDVFCLRGVSGLSNLHISHSHRGVEIVCSSEMLCPLTRLHGVTTQETIIWTVTIMRTSKVITELIYDSLVSKVMSHGLDSSGFTPSKSAEVFFSPLYPDWLSGPTRPPFHLALGFLPPWIRTDNGWS
jgi:hypothetical protein